jgi:hypothetical protein
MTNNINNNFTYKLLDTDQTAQLLNCTRRKLESDRLKGGGIRYIKIGKSVRYDIRDIENYIQANTVNSTSQPRGL